MDSGERSEFLTKIFLRLASDSHELKHCGGSLRCEIRVTNPDCQTQEQDESTRRVERGRQRRDKTRARSLRLQVYAPRLVGNPPQPKAWLWPSLLLGPVPWR